MFTRSCREVNVGSVATRRCEVDLRHTIDHRFGCPGAALEKTMLRSIFRRRPAQLIAGNENAPGWVSNPSGVVEISKVRALATGAALATAVDSSPAVLVSIYDYAHRYRDRGR